jgi:hypothetical protein
MQYHLVEWKNIGDIMSRTIKYKDFNLEIPFLYQEGASAQSFPIVGLDRPLGLQEVEAPRMSRHSTHDCGSVSAQLTADFTLRLQLCYTFLLEG